MTISYFKTVWIYYLTAVEVRSLTQVSVGSSQGMGGRCSFWSFCRRIRFLNFPASTHLLVLAHSLPHVRTSNEASHPSSFFSLWFFAAGNVVPSEGPLWSHWVTQIIQNTLPSSRSLTLVISAKSLCHGRWHIYRFWQLRHGLLWKVGTSSCSLHTWRLETGAV